ncbi:MAG: MAPEG family protein [Pseudomonadota bacterium]
MTPELTVLALAGLLQVVQFALMAVPVNIQLGTRYTASSREEQLQPTGAPGRLFRAMNNHFEGLILFGIAVVVVVLGEKTSAFTAACAWAYLIARVLYVPVYAAGIPYLRSLIWGVGFAATTAMLIAALL